MRCVTSREKDTSLSSFFSLTLLDNIIIYKKTTLQRDHHAHHYHHHFNHPPSNSTHRLRVLEIRAIIQLRCVTAYVVHEVERHGILVFVLSLQIEREIHSHRNACKTMHQHQHTRTDSGSVSGDFSACSSGIIFIMRILVHSRIHTHTQRYLPSMLSGYFIYICTACCCDLCAAQHPFNRGFGLFACAHSVEPECTLGASTLGASDGWMDGRTHAERVLLYCLARTLAISTEKSIPPSPQKESVRHGNQHGDMVCVCASAHRVGGRIRTKPGMGDVKYAKLYSYNYWQADAMRLGSGLRMMVNTDTDETAHVRRNSTCEATQRRHDENNGCV